MKRISFFVGVGILVFLAVAYFVPFSYQEQELGITSVTETTLFGEVIFYSPFVLALYVFIAIVLVVYGLRVKKKR